MVGWHHQFHGPGFEQSLRDCEGQGSLACYGLWAHKELDTTWWLNQQQSKEGEIGERNVKVLVAPSCPTLAMQISRREDCSRLPCPPPGNLPDPGIKHGSPASHADSLPSEPPGKTRETGNQL